MGLLDNTIQKEYYQGDHFGNYQFTSLEDIITQFEIAYVGENKIIPRIKRTDIAFYAQRALQEFSFDTFKSIKAQQIDLPPTLVMPLPHDYVNYTKLSWVDTDGVKHPLQPMKDTSNPFQIRQEDDGSYSFPTESEEVVDGDFAIGDLSEWQNNDLSAYNSVEIKNNALQFLHRSRGGYKTPGYWGYTNVVFQRLDVSDKNYVDLSATGLAVNTTATTSTQETGQGTLRVGLSKNLPDSNNMNFKSSLLSSFVKTTNSNTSIFELSNADGDSSYLEWTVAADGTTATSKEILGINVVDVDEIYVIAVSFHDFTNALAIESTLQETNVLDNISVIDTYASTSLQTPLANIKNSSTWESYKSHIPSENNINDYQDYQNDIYWPNEGRRYGLDPHLAQVNGSFYIDQRLGRIHFSSNISGKTVILDYISDSLGTDAEMQVHKFAEEAMYKWIAYAILSTSSMPIHQQLAPRFKKERFAETRKAKLRLSNIKLEELTQILRGKSKQIKH